MLDLKNSISSKFVDHGFQKKGKYKRRETVYTFKCKESDCNNLIEAHKYDLKKLTGRCRKCSDKNTGRLSVERNAKEPYRALYNKFIYDRDRFAQKSDISFADFLEFTKINNCHYCNGEITWAIKALYRNGYRYNLDRKDNVLGYLKCNVVTCCWKCNETKSDRFTYEQFIKIGKTIKSFGGHNGSKSSPVLAVTAGNH